MAHTHNSSIQDAKAEEEDSKLETSLGYMVSLSQNKTNSKDARSSDWSRMEEPQQPREEEDGGGCGR